MIRLAPCINRITDSYPDGFRKEARSDRQEASVKNFPPLPSRIWTLGHRAEIRQELNAFIAINQVFSPRILFCQSYADNQTPTNVWTQAGESLRVSTTESEDDSRVKWLCLRYVERILGCSGGFRRQISMLKPRSHHEPLLWRY
jgi:hypothetical protein